MPRINRHGKIAMGSGTSIVSHDGNIVRWTANSAPTEALVGQPIEGTGTAWVDSSTLIFQACVDGTCEVYFYNIYTNAISGASAFGADVLRAGGGTSAAWLEGTGYYDSFGRESATFGLADVDKTDGTVLVILDHDTGTGLGYLTPDDVSVANVHVICHDTLDGNASIGNGVVVYKTGGLLHRYVIDTEQRSTSTVPVTPERNDGDYVVAWHPVKNGWVVFKFGDQFGWQVTRGNEDFWPDICVLEVGVAGQIRVATSKGINELPHEINSYLVNTTAPLVDLGGLPSVLAPSVPAVTDPVTAADIITVGRNPNGSERGVSKLILSTDWFGATGGADIRGAWQYDTTAVVARTGNTNSYVTAKNSNGLTWSPNEEAYGSHAVAIRPATTSNASSVLWEVTWVRSAAAYARATLNATMQLVGSITETPMVFDANGLLDLNNAGTPLPTANHRDEQYGYTTIDWATTRGDWTIGQDSRASVERLIAWNANTEIAYVVWNGSTSAQSRLALEYDTDGNATPVVVPANQTFAVRFSQFYPLGQIDMELGVTPGITPPFTATSTGTGATATTTATSVSVPATPEALTRDTRVFRQPQSIPPTAPVLMAFKNKGTAAPSSTGSASASMSAAIAAGGALAATVMGSGSGSLEEEPPSYNPTYPYNTVLAESESGHLIEVDDSPGAERVHIYHRSGSHIEMRPDGGVKYKTVKKRQDITIGDQDLYVAGDWNIVVEGGYSLHVRKGELIIDVKDDASLSVKGKLKISADNIEMKAKNHIFLNAPKVDLGGISPGGMPMMSLPSGVVPLPTPAMPPIFVPRVKLPVGPKGMTALKSLDMKKMKDGNAAEMSKATTLMSQHALDASGEPAFSRLKEQPSELPLSNPNFYAAGVVAGTAGVLAAQQLRGRLFDTPEDVGNSESYTSHHNLSVELGDFAATQKNSPGTIVQSDTSLPTDEPHPTTTFPLASGGSITCTANTVEVIGRGTKFTEDLQEGDVFVLGGVDATVQSIASDTALQLTTPWAGATTSGVMRVYRLRPIKEFFGTFTYGDSARLGESGLSLGQLMVNFSSPVVEVPIIKEALLQGGSGVGSDGAGGDGGGGGECGDPDPSVPNIFGVVGSVFNSGTYDLTTDAGSGQFVEAVIAAAPGEWGHVGKSGGQTQHNGHAVDAIMYKSSTPLSNGKYFQVVDIVVASGGADAHIGWSPVCSPAGETPEAGPQGGWYR